VAVGMLPAAICRALLSSESAGGPVLTVGLALAFLPYVLMALLMAFLHDDAFAAMPLNVITALIQIGGSFLLLSAFVAFIVLFGAGAFALAILLRNGHFLIYLLATVGCWSLFIWVSIVVMRLLGNQYYRHRQVLRWNQERPRWGVAWKL
jgi:hypothetical protein